MRESLTILCPVSIWFVLMVFVTTLCFAIHDGVRRLRRLHQIPCSRCAFFTGEYQLKCTVQPCKALSEAAIGCPDYQPAPPRLGHLSRRRRPWKR
ncbi:MAG TPA: hypothetical protein V6C88_09475 [Chroococcidiopsis sp.]